MDGTCCLVEKLWDLVLNLTWVQLRYLVECHENIEKLNGLLVELTLERSSVQHQIDEDTNNGREIEEKVHHWLCNVNEISEKVRELQQEENPAKTRCSLTSCPNLWLRYKLSKNAKELAEKVAEIKGKLKIDKFCHRRPPQWMPELTNGESNGRIDSRVSIMNEAMGALQDPNIKIIGLWGLGGVGKTTIAREAAKKARDENIFEKVVEVVVPKNLNVGDIQDQIAGWLGMTLDHKEENIRASYLCRRLMKEKNLLLIMDDLWGKIGFAQVGIPFINGKGFKQEGCKILLTSRDENLLRNEMECEKIIKVGVLSDVESWDLFKGIAELSNDQNDQNLILVALDIARKCQGLPLAIVAVAKALRKKDLREWKDAFNQLESHSERDITGEVDSTLRLSYDHLRPEHKPIFLLSAMLSRDPSIRDLLMYSMGLGLLKRGENMEGAQNAIFTIVQKLKALSLLLDSFSNDHFTIHDCFRDVALNIASAEQHAFIRRHRGLGEWPDESSLERICWEKCDIISDLPEELRAPSLKFFLLNSKNRDLAIPDTFFKSTNELRVLSFINICFSSLPSLGSLKKLRTLCLHSCRLKDITKVGSLKQLTILSLAYSDIEQLPSQLACLTSLQMLNLAHCSRLKVIAPGILSSLKKLEVLCMEESFCGWEAEGSSEGNGNASLDELKDLPISSLDVHIPNACILPKDLFLGFNLERYRIFIVDDTDWEDDILTKMIWSIQKILGQAWRGEGRYKASKTLMLDLDGIHLEAGVGKLFEGVEDLYLKGSNGLDNGLDSLDEGGFRNLKHLHVKDNGNIRYIAVDSRHLKVAFPILETLKLERLKGLENLCQGPIPATVFQNLKVITVRFCDHLKRFFSISMGGLFSRLESIEIVHCKSLMEIVSFNMEDSSSEQSLVTDIIKFDQLHSLWMDGLTSLTDFSNDRATDDTRSKRNVKAVFNHKVLFPMMKLLMLSSLNNMISSIWDDQLSDNSFSNLRKLVVRQCGFVKLIPFQVLKSLSNLEELEVSDCKELETVFDLEDLNNYKETPQSSSVEVPLKKLELHSLPKLKDVGSNHHNKGNVSFQSLRQVEVSFFRSLTSVFPAFIAKGMLQHLERLKIWNCDIEVIVFSLTNVTHLDVMNCGQLTALLTSSASRSLVHLTCLTIHLCYQIEEIITKQEGEDDEDRKIIFKKLQHLELGKLDRLKSFCGHNYSFEFPLLEHVTVTECPRLTMFCGGAIHAPRLESIKVAVNPDENIWMGDLNNTIQHWFTAQEDDHS